MPFSKLPDFALEYFHSDEMRLLAIVVIVVGVFVIPSYLWYSIARFKAANAHAIALRNAEAKLEQARTRRLGKRENGK